MGGMRTELGRVRGLGSAKTGVHHWWLQRVTAFTNLALIVWLLSGLLALPVVDYAHAHAWLASPWGAVPMAFLIVSVIWHARLGFHVAIEDYSHGARRVLLSGLMNGFLLLCGGIALYALIRIALSGAPLA